MICRSHIKSLIPLLTIRNNVSFQTPFELEEKHVSLFFSFFLRGPYFIMGKTMQLEKPHWYLQYICVFPSIKPKIFTTACNTVRVSMMRKICGKWIMKVLRMSLYAKKKNVFVCLLFLGLYFRLKSTMLLFLVFFSQDANFPFHTPPQKNVHLTPFISSYAQSMYIWNWYVYLRILPVYVMKMLPYWVLVKFANNVVFNHFN